MEGFDVLINFTRLVACSFSYKIGKMKKFKTTGIIIANVSLHSECTSID